MSLIGKTVVRDDEDSYGSKRRLTFHDGSVAIFGGDDYYADARYEFYTAEQYAGLLRAQAEDEDRRLAAIRQREQSEPVTAGYFGAVLKEHYIEPIREALNRQVYGGGTT